MKTLRVIGIAILSLFIISCASKPSASVENQIQEKTETEELAEIVESLIDEDTDEENIESAGEEETDENIEVLEEADEDETESVYDENDIIHQELEEIVEPEVIDIEPPLEEELPEEEEPAIESEIIPDAEKEIEELPPVEVKLEDTKTEPEPVVEVAVNELKAATEEQPVQVEEVAVVTDESDDVECLDGDEDSSNTLKNEEVIIPSRSVKMNLMEYVDIVYPGNGWIFMGLTDKSKDLTYNGRQIGTENTKFSLQAKFSGTKILHFYKNDPVKNQFIDDYVEVIVSKEKGNSKTHVVAPDYKSPLPKSELKEEKTPVEDKVETKVETEKKVEAKTETSVQKTVAAPKTEAPVQKTVSTPKVESKSVSTSKVEQKSVTTPKVESKPVVKEEPKAPAVIPEEEPAPTVDTDALFKEAKEAYDAKNYNTAANKLNQFLEYSTSNRDEALYMLGQIYEAPGQSQNVQSAINSYTTLINNYPASKYWDNANKRIIYLKRFYMEGR